MAEKLQLVKANNFFVSRVVKQRRTAGPEMAGNGAAGGCRGSSNSAALAPSATKWGKDPDCPQKVFFFFLIGTGSKNGPLL